MLRRRSSPFCSTRQGSQIPDMKILILGSGGREHALAWKVKQSSLCSELFIGPGNAGTVALGTNVPCKLDDFETVSKAVSTCGAQFVIVGPDDPLAAGIVDYLNEKYPGLPVLGPTASGARLEGSKSFAKAFMARHGIPTAAYRVFEQAENEEAKEYIKQQGAPIVLKADGLAAGKGVAVCQNVDEALDFLAEVFENNRFGASGSRVVMEQFLDGIELSVFALTDGKEYILLPDAKDYKRAGEGDTGPNTGGMGSVSPVPFMRGEFRQRVIDRIVEPTIKGLSTDGIPYRGFVFFGLINVGGDPYVIEYNARMGDPETQVVMPRIQTDLVPYLLQTARGELQPVPLDVTPDCAAAVIAVSEGYPGHFEKGKAISGLEENENSILFHAGTRQEGENIVTSGGRVLAVVSLSPTLKHALEKSYATLRNIKFDNLSYRKDIGQDLLTF